jgi:hypothetical protein
LLTELHVSELRTLAPLLRGLVDDHDPNRDPGLNQN